MLRKPMGNVGAIAGTVTVLRTGNRFILFEFLAARMKSQRNAAERWSLGRKVQIRRSRNTWFVASTLLSMVVLSGTAGALDPHRLISQYAHTVWRVQDGLPRGPSAVTQTSDGYIWIAAGRALLRFDGVRMTTVPSQNSFPTENAGINSLLGTEDGSLWMATYSGLYRLKDGIGFSFPIQGGVQNIIAGSGGTVWFTEYINHGLGTGLLCEITGNDLRCHDERGGKVISDLTQDSFGNIWFGCQMLCRWSHGSVNYFLQDEMNHPSNFGVVGLAASSDGSVWVALDGTGPNAGVGQLRDGQFVSYTAPGFDGTKVRATALFLDRRQTLWIATGAQGLYHIHDGSADHFGAAQGLSSDAVASIFEDREGSLWVATEGGVDLFRDLPVANFSSVEGVHNDPSAILSRGDGSVWVGSAAGLSIIHAGSVSPIAKADGQLIHDVDALLDDHSGRLWLAINQTLVTYQAGKFSKIQGLDGHPLGSVGDIPSLCEDIDGNIWALAQDLPKQVHHLLQIRGRRLQADIEVTNIIPQAHFLAPDPAGGLWIGTLDGKLFHFLHGVAKLVSNGRTGGRSVTMGSFSIDTDGVLWGATTRGLYRWERGSLSVLDSHNGLPCSSFGAAIKDASGSLWLSANCGFLQIPTADVASWSVRPDGQVTAAVLGPLDGADPGFFTKRVQPNSARSPDGRLWFIGSSTVQMIDPAHLYKNTIPPPVHVEDLIADGKTYSTASPISLPPLTRDFQIDYTALSFVLPQRMAFRYMLDGRDRSWQDPGLRRQAFYNDLPPGGYRFRVIASNNDGVWNRVGASLEFRIAPAWYQTQWFRLATGLLILLLLAALYRLRVRQIGKAMNARFDERLAERTRIARELHDTFLQTIQGSKLVADDALNPATDLPRMRQAMVTLSAWLGRATDEGRAALNSLRSSATEVNDLAESFRRAIDECRMHSGMEATLEVVGEIQPMHPVVRDEVYRIGYEAIRNACVHSHAERLWVELSYLKDLSLLVRDNGAGMDLTIAEKGKAGHYGLTGMRERAVRIAAKLTIKSVASEGTSIELVVPGGIIYNHTNSKRRREHKG
jgi:signal transduction histidine kinase/ligand-binding sensor domain-containing protein